MILDLNTFPTHGSIIKITVLAHVTEQLDKNYPTKFKLWQKRRESLGPLYEKENNNTLSS